MFAVLGQHDLQAICCGSAVKNSFIHEDIQGTCDRSFYVSLIAVSPSLQGQGLGKKIMADYCTMIKASGFDDVYVRCRESNGAMRHILDLNSFGVTQRYDSELGGVVCTRLIYKKSLAS